MQSNPTSFTTAPDSFKESLSANDVSSAITSGLLKFEERSPGSFGEFLNCPMSDGGEGILDIFKSCASETGHSVHVQDPLGRNVAADYIVQKETDNAVIEMARASGLTLVSEQERDPEITSTYGTGQLIASAMRQRFGRIVIGIGGSATNDAGTGLAAALRFRFLDKDGKPVRPCGANLERIHAIDDSNKHPALESTEILIACDVDNPLCGPNGATMTYSAQKGATPEQMERLEAGMQHFAEVLDDYAGRSISTMPGAGAAGGVGAGLMAFCGAKLQPGFDLIASLHNLDYAIKLTDLVITGEGRMDAQTLHGKVPAGVAKIAKRYNKSCVAFCGDVADREALEELGFFGIYSIMDIAKNKDDAMQNAAYYLEQLAATFARDWKRVIDSQP